MNLAEWHEVLRTKPLTPGQLAAILAEFRRLGLDGEADRARRLAVTAVLAGRDAIATTCDLMMGEAGRCVRALRDCASRADLEALLPAEGGAGAPEAAARTRPRLPLVLMLARALADADRLQRSRLVIADNRGHDHDVPGAGMRAGGLR